MTSRATRRFWKAFEQLPAPVERTKRQAFKIFSRNPHHSSLKFKRVHSNKEIYSVRVGLGYRALAVREGTVMIWYWIGSHAESARSPTAKVAEPAVIF
jgi:hypothetical protein